MSAYPFKRILLATEHTEFDTGAERIAFAMAQRCGMPLRVVLPVMTNPVYEVEAPDLAMRDELTAAGKVDDLKKRAAEMKVELDVHIRHGAEPYREILDEAKECGADLIVIRRRGKPGFLSNHLIGEMVGKVIHGAPCAVLMAPRKAAFWKSGVLAAVGDMPTSASVTRHAATIASICGLPLTVVSVADRSEAQSETERLNAESVAAASKLCERVSGRVVGGTPVEQTVAIAQEIAADLIVIGRQRYHLLPLGGRGVMQRIAGALDVTTLVIPPKAD